MTPATTLSGKDCTVLDKALFCVIAATHMRQTVYFCVGKGGYTWTKNFDDALKIDISMIEDKVDTASIYNFDIDSGSMKPMRVLPALRPLDL